MCIYLFVCLRSYCVKFYKFTFIVDNTCAVVIGSITVVATALVVVTITTTASQYYC